MIIRRRLIVLPSASSSSDRSMGDVRSPGDPEDDEETSGSSPPFCRASYFPIIRMCSRRSNHASSRTSCPSAPRTGDDAGDDAGGGGAMTADAPPIERRAVRDRNGRILFYYAPLPGRGPAADDETVGCRVSLCKSRSAGEILSTSATPSPAVGNARFAVPLQVRRRQMDDIRRRLAAVDVDDDDSDGSSCRQFSDDAESRLDDHINSNRGRLMVDDNDDELDRHRKQRLQRLQQAVSCLQNSADVRRGGSVESDCGSRSDRDSSTDGSASASTDTDHDAASITVSLRLQQQ